MGTAAVRNRFGLLFNIQEHSGLTTVSRKCSCCDSHHEFELDMTLNQFRAGWAEWLGGKLVQDAFKDTSPEDKEFMQTAICPTCFDSTLSPDSSDDSAV